MYRILKPLMLLSVLVLSGCASTSNTSSNDMSGPRDPLESLNRKVWDFNWNVLDKNFFRPMAVSYVENVPLPVRTGLYNAATNLEEPSSAINNLLQGKVGPAVENVGRFVINSTVGLFGIFDVAQHMGMEPQLEEFGEVLGVYGVGTGPYLMFPGMGPSDVRDKVGDFVDGSYYPVSELNIYTTILRYTIKGLHIRGELIQRESLLDGAIDPYNLVKDIYFQNVENKVNDGEVAEEELEELEELENLLDEID